MYGDIVYVERKPIEFINNAEYYKNNDWSFIDEIINRTLSYKHYGIDVGNDEIIHFVGSSYLKRKESKIIKTTKKEFAKTGIIKTEKKYLSNYSKEEVVKRAYSKLGSNFGIYSILNNNCEHFATWCLLGKKQSTQTYVVNHLKKIKKVPRKAQEKILRLRAYIN